MDVQPNVNDQIVLRDDAGREYPSEVVNHGVSLLVVLQPDLPDEDEPFEAGTKLDVVWTDAEDVVWIVPTKILVVHPADDDVKPQWSLFVTEPAYTAQRRRQVRVPAEGPVELLPAADHEIDAVTGSLVDVSEGAVRCTVEAGSADGFLGGRSEAVAEFRLGTVDFSLPGRVEFLRSTSRPAEFEDLVVVFDEPVADVEALREQIVAQQALIPEGEH